MRPRDLLESARPQDLIADPVTSTDAASAMLSGLWLYFDWLDKSHRISQSLENPTGSFWHGLLQSFKLLILFNNLRISALNSCTE